MPQGPQTTDNLQSNKTQVHCVSQPSDPEQHLRDTAETTSQKNAPQQSNILETAERLQSDVSPHLGSTTKSKEALNANMSKLNLQAPPVPQALRHLSIDHPEIVLREPTRFGTIHIDREKSATYIYLNKIPTTLTKSEKEFVYRCEKTGHTQKCQYQDTRQIHMYRYPYNSCGHSIINNKTVPASISAHFREYHGAIGQQYQVHYTYKGHTAVYHHGTPKTAQKKHEEAAMALVHENKSIFKKKDKPHYTQPTILEAFLKIRKKGLMQTPKSTTQQDQTSPKPDCHWGRNETGRCFGGGTGARDECLRALRKR